MKDYDFPESLELILKRLRDIKKDQSYKNLYKKAPKEHQDTMKKAYLQALRLDLICLSTELDDWVMDGAQMVKGEKDGMDKEQKASAGSGGLMPAC